MKDKVNFTKEPEKFFFFKDVYEDHICLNASKVIFCVLRESEMNGNKYFIWEFKLVNNLSLFSPQFEEEKEAIDWLKRNLSIGGI